MKRFLAVMLVVVFVFAFTGCGAKESKKDIFSLVEKNYDAILKACEEKDEETLLSIDGITQVNIVDGYVLVYCKGAGIAPSSQDYGFYYSEENIPVAGEYTLGMLNMHGQRISIQVTLPRKDGTGSVIFITGWMVEANGKIRLVTPYGGK